MSYYAKRFFGQQGIVTDGLKLWLDASNPVSYPGSGTTWYDLSGNGNNGTLLNGVTPLSNAMQFDGVDDRVQTNYNAQLNDFTVSVWFKSNTNIAYSRLVDKSYAYGMWLGRNSNIANSWGGGIRQSAPPYGLFITLQDNQWNNITMVRNGSTQLMYGNGVLLNSNTCNNLSLDTTAFAFGNWSVRNNEMLKGNENDILIYNRALTQAEITQNFEVTKHKYGL